VVVSLIKTNPLSFGRALEGPLVHGACGLLVTARSWILESGSCNLESGYWMLEAKGDLKPGLN